MALMTSDNTANKRPEDDTERRSGEGGFKL